MLYFGWVTYVKTLGLKKTHQVCLSWKKTLWKIFLQYLQNFLLPIWKLYFHKSKHHVSRSKIYSMFSQVLWLNSPEKKCYLLPFLGADQKTVILFFVSNKLGKNREIWELQILQCPFLSHSRLIFPIPPLLQVIRKNSQKPGCKRGMGICQSGMANLLRQLLCVLTKPNLTAWINKITTDLERRGKTRAGSIDLRKAVNDRRKDIYLCRWLWPWVN